MRAPEADVSLMDAIHGQFVTDDALDRDCQQDPDVCRLADHGRLMPTEAARIVSFMETLIGLRYFRRPGAHAPSLSLGQQNPSLVCEVAR